MDAVLVMFKADGTRRDFPVSGDSVTLGRERGCDLRIPKAEVSRRHCSLLLDGGVRVRDLGSTNGTFVNGVRIENTQLEAGDELTVGPVTFTIMINGQPDPVLNPADVDAQTEPELTAQAVGGSTGGSGPSGSATASEADGAGDIDLSEFSVDDASDDSGLDLSFLDDDDD